MDVFYSRSKSTTLNIKDVSLILVLTGMMAIIAVGYSIRSYFDRGEYLYMGASLAFGIVLMFVMYKLYLNSIPHKTLNKEIVK